MQKRALIHLKSGTGHAKANGTIKLIFQPKETFLSK